MVYQILLTHPQNESIPFPLHADKIQSLAEVPFSTFLKLISSFPGCKSPSSLQIPLKNIEENKRKKTNIKMTGPVQSMPSTQGGIASKNVDLQQKNMSKNQSVNNASTNNENDITTTELTKEEKEKQWYELYLNRNKNLLYFQDPSDPLTFYLYHPILSAKRILNLNNNNLTSNTSIFNQNANQILEKLPEPMEKNISQEILTSKQTNLSPYISIKFLTGSNEKFGHIIIYISQMSSRYIQNLVDSMKLSQILAKRFGLSLFRLENNQWSKITTIWYNERFLIDVKEIYSVEWNRRRLITIEKLLSPLEWPLKGQIDVVSEFFKFKVNILAFFSNNTKESSLSNSNESDIQIRPDVTDREILLWLRNNLDSLIESRETVVDFGNDYSGKKIQKYCGFKCINSYLPSYLGADDETNEDDQSSIKSSQNMTDEDIIDSFLNITLIKYMLYLTHRRSQTKRVIIEYHPNTYQLVFSPYHASTIGKLNRYLDWNIISSATFVAIRLLLIRSKIPLSYVTFNDKPITVEFMKKIDQNIKDTAFEFYLWWKKEGENY